MTLTTVATTTESRVPITVTVEDVTFRVPKFSKAQRIIPCVAVAASDRNPTGSYNPPECKTVEVLRGNTLVAKPGELTAIIGPSGSGKTTLLNVIGARAQGKIEGRVTFNNVDVTSRPRNLRGCAAMCYSNDQLLPFLTVEEALYFAAVLKMGNFSREARHKRISDVLDELALDHVRHNRIGGRGDKGISTGEARRTSLGVELVGDPAVLLLDEPTSGLDAVLALEVMLVLRRLALRGRTVLCTIHQPRAAIYELFDSLVLMSKGQILYHGPARRARTELAQYAGVPINEDLVAADDLIDIATWAGGIEGQAKDKVTNIPSADEIAAAWRGSTLHAAVLEDIAAAHFQDSAAIKLTEMNVIVHWFLEIAAITYRCARNNLRNPLAFALVTLIQGVMGCFLGIFFYKLPNDYLPSTIPPDIGSEQSSVMYLFNNTASQFVLTGIDGTGYNPLLEMMISGVDGNMSEPLAYLQDAGVLEVLAPTLECVFEKMDLDLCYPEVTFNHKDVLDESVTDYVSTILSSLDVADYMLGKYTWKNGYDWLMLHADNFFYLGAMLCHSQLRTLTGTFNTCSGLPLLPRVDVPGPLTYVLCSSYWTSYNAGQGVPSTYVCSDNSIYLRDPNYKDIYQAGEAQEIVDMSANADLEVAKGRRLQAAALALSASELYNALPPVASRILTRLPLYQDAFSSCNHAACDLIGEVSTSNHPGWMRGLAALGDYGSVLGAILNIVGALFFAITNIGFAAYDALVSFPQERVMINREMANHHYKPSSYILGRTFGDFLFQLIPSILLVTCFYLLIGVDLGEHGIHFWRYLGVCFLTVWAAYGFTYTTSAASPTMEVAVVVAPVILVVLLCCSGFFVRDAALPAFMAWVKYLSFYRWAFYAVILNQFPPDDSYAGVPNSFSLALAGIHERSITWCCVMLVVLGLGFRVLGYLALKFMHRKIGIEE
eukprot:Blabericola_migrator_1__1017@NODE_1256_length_4964_cov_342_362671_g849_i0_p1_GENE_NODE_1256_length_4964_cov_342_362671_g849_i0NODE_1256_length_4964_cov_342_362671_g849_i0_p1_ORF_typecomplete_len945_score126_15ABC2_membrane/PF01061_24/0_11ABC2_membrane/PF01061_24/6_3e32ABC_tran/PF00005_27/7_7e28ABC2_membrane_3/PF12698_7/1_1e03ABC2_membrane_3/PF12698_7/9_8e10AAA_21/PF13304_6/0_00016AAA_29/PF13555_6/5_8e05AAA_16/PF13191_6/0_00014AAA_22/PF13401_6/0_00029CcmB/PF03379_13/0_00039T2SSE/PF00437_20/0_016T